MVYIAQKSCCTPPATYYNLCKIDPATGNVIWSAKIILNVFSSVGIVNCLYELYPVPFSNDIIAAVYDNVNNWALIRIDNTGTIVWQTGIIAGNPPTVPKPTSTLYGNTRMLYVSTSLVYVIGLVGYGAHSGTTGIYEYNVNTGALVSNNVLAGYRAVNGAAFKVTTGIGATHAAILYCQSISPGFDAYVVYDLDSPGIISTTPLTSFPTIIPFPISNKPGSVHTNADPSPPVLFFGQQLLNDVTFTQTLYGLEGAIAKRAFWNAAKNQIAAIGQYGTTSGDAFWQYDGSTFTINNSWTAGPMGPTNYNPIPSGAAGHFKDVVVDSASTYGIVYLAADTMQDNTGALAQVFAFDASITTYNGFVWASPARVGSPSDNSAPLSLILGNDGYLYLGGRVSA